MPSTLVWTVTVLALGALFALDFTIQARKPHEPSTREAALWCAGYVLLALVFGAAMVSWWSGPRATEFVAGYVTELSLSMDNLFVFLLIMGRGRVPREYQQKVLLLGIAIALGARAVFIFLGAAVLSAFSWTFYLFGAYLLFVAFRLAFEKEEAHDVEPETESRVARLFARLLPVTRSFHGGKLVAVESGRRVVTPLLLTLVTLGFTDVLFALDSIPAVYGLTDQAYIVLVANAFALMGLRQMYFLIGGLLDRLVYLSYGLAAILAFIGVKLILHAAHASGLHVPEISTPLSLTVIGVVLVVVVVASLVKTRRAN